MVQTFQVLRCFKCEVFQVHPTKKSNKWKCKLCNEKQSMKRFYGLGTGKECRLHVQKLNGIRGDIDSTHCESDASDPCDGSESPEQSEETKTTTGSVAMKSKWLDYVHTEENIFTEQTKQIPNETMLLSDTEVVLELPKKRPRKYFAVSTQIVNNPKTECLPEKKSQHSTLSNANKKVNIVKSYSIMKTDKNKPNVSPCKTGAVDVSTSEIVKNSKWAQFLEDTQISEDENGTDPIIYSEGVSSLKPMFPFLEEEDLDSVLDL